MTVDYDAPRRKQDDLEPTDSLEELAVRRSEAPPALEVDDADLLDGVELPGADLSGEELTVRVIPKQADEFTCSSCFLVQHHSRMASGSGNTAVCVDCA